MDTGVWIGNRALKDLDGLNISILNINHWAVMIDRKVYSLTTNNN